MRETEGLRAQTAYQRELVVGMMKYFDVTAREGHEVALGAATLVTPELGTRRTSHSQSILHLNGFVRRH